MKILINCSGNLRGGGLQVAFSFVNECIHFTNNEYYILLGEAMNNLIDKSLFPENFHFIDIPNIHKLKRSHFLSKIEQKHSPDVVFTIFGPSYWRPKNLHIAGFALGYYLYPESLYWNKISIKEKIVNSFRKLIHLQYLKKDIDVFICETEDATQRLKKLIKKKKYYTVSNTFGAHFFSPTFSPEITNKIDLTTKFVIVSICNYAKHKNLDILKEVVDILENRGQNVTFILTIKKEIYTSKFGEKYKNSIINIGPTKPVNCPTLYSISNAVIVPSLLECFTANFPEAMIMKKPILASDLSFSRSICKDAAIYFNPANAEDIANNIQELIKNTNLQTKLIELGTKRVNEFPSPRERAEMYLNICETELKQRNNVTI